MLWPSQGEMDINIKLTLRLQAPIGAEQLIGAAVAKVKEAAVECDVHALAVRHPRPLYPPIPAPGAQKCPYAPSH